MGSIGDLPSWLKHERSLDGANRPMRMRVAHLDKKMDGILLPQKIVGGEAICGGVDYEVWCVATDARLPLKQFIGLPIAIDLVTDQGELRSICGIVTEAAAGDSDGGVACYKLRMRDAMAIMEMRVRTRIFREMNEFQIVELIAGEWRQANGVLAGTFDFEIERGFHATTYPCREFTMQYNESDAAFIRRLLSRRGISWFFRAGRGRESAGDQAGEGMPAHTLVLFNSADQLQRNASGSVRYHPGGATEESDTVTSWGAIRKLQAGSVARFSWDYKYPRGRHAMEIEVRGLARQGPNGDALSASLDDYQIVTPHAGNDGNDLRMLGQLQMERKEFDSKCFVADCTVRTFCVAEYFTLTGHPEIDTHPAAERDFVITAFSITAQNNLPRALAAKVERLFERSRWQRDATGQAEVRGGDEVDSGPVRCKVSITAVRRGVRIVPAFDPRTDLPHPQTQSVIVVGPPGEEVHCDSLGRVKVRFPGARGRTTEPGSDAGADDTSADSAWVRVASNWAGNGPGSARQCGTLGLPRVGTEALVSFLDGDPDKPVIVGQLYNGDAEPAALSARGALPGNRYLSGIKSREIGGGRANQLRLDDSTGRINAQLASDHGTSQLNLGFLVHPLANGHGEGRGEGAELRSDHAVAIRGGKGVLISAHASADASGEQLDRRELTGLLDALAKLAEQLSKLAVTHALDEAAGPDLAQLVDRLKQLHCGANVAASGGGGAPIVALGGPAGVVVGSGQNMALGAQTNIDLLSAGDTSAAAGGHILLRAALDISLFANELGMKLIASKGPVRMQAQEDSLEVLAKKVLELISTTDWINIKAKQGVRIYGGGSELEISAAGIKGYTGGKHEMYAADHQTFPKQERPMQFPGELPHHEICLPCMLKAARAHSPLVEAK
jgi:type VI secretion system secreted protein VgrG